MLPSEAPGDIEVKFQRFSAAYVAVGGSPRCAATSRNGTEMAGGNL
jgi:hypothetical protein